MVCPSVRHFGIDGSGLGISVPQAVRFLLGILTCVLRTFSVCRNGCPMPVDWISVIISQLTQSCLMSPTSRNRQNGLQRFPVSSRNESVKCPKRTRFCGNFRFLGMDIPLVASRRVMPVLHSSDQCPCPTIFQNAKTGSRNRPFRLENGPKTTIWDVLGQNAAILSDFDDSFALIRTFCIYCELLSSKQSNLKVKIFHFSDHFRVTLG